MSEGGRVSGYTGHRPSKYPDLRHSHRASRGLKSIKDHLSHRTINGVNEHRAPGRNRVIRVRALFGRIDLWITHGTNHICERRSKFPEWRDDALASLGFSRIDHYGHYDQLAMNLFGKEGHRWRDHDVRDGGELLRRGFCLGDERGDGISCRGQNEHASHDRINFVQPELEAGRDTEVAAAAANRPEQVRMRFGFDAQELAIRGYNVSG